MKRCSRCNTEKPLDEFPRRPSRKSGVASWCKMCCCAYGKAYYAANRERILAEIHAWRAANPDRKREHDRKWLAANRERKRANDRERQRRNLVRCREYNMRHNSRKRAARTEPFTYAAVLWRDGYRCHVCARDVEPAQVQYDHVVPLARGGEHSYDNVRVAHALCNQRKGAKLMDELLSTKED